MTLSEIRAILETRGLRPNKKLGQNFLHDQNLCAWIASLCGDAESVVEVGPGLGSLTRALLDRGVAVTSVELDRGYAQFLKESLASSEKFTLVEGDALELLPGVAGQGTCLVGNLPYNISTPLIMEACSLEHPPQRMVFTLQLEMAERLCAQSGTKAFGAVSVVVQTRYRSSLERRLPPSVFFPTPGVHSAVAVLDLLPGKTPEPWLDFVTFVKRAFAAKRKTMANCLASEKISRDAWSACLEREGLGAMVRAEAVGLDVWPRLFNYWCDKK